MRSETTQCLIREARPEDASALSSLAIRSKSSWGYPEEFMETCVSTLTVTIDDILDSRAHTMLAEMDGRVVGYYRLKKLGTGELSLDGLFVEPELIGCGVGRTLMEHARACAAAQGASRLLIQADPRAEGFYVSAGGTFTGHRESADIPGRYLSTFTVDLRRAHPRPDSQVA